MVGVSSQLDADSVPAELGPVQRVKHHVPGPLRHALTIFILLLLLEYFVIPKLSGAYHSLRDLHGFNIGWLVAGIIFEAASLFCYALLTRAVLGTRSLSLWTLLRIDLSTLAVSHVLPGGTAAGTGLGYRLLTSNGVTRQDGGFTLATQGIGSAVVLNILLWLALVISIPLAGFNPAYVTVALVSVLLLLALGTLVYLLTKGQDSAARAIRAVTRPIPHLDEARVENILRRIGERIGQLVQNRRLLRTAAGWAALNWILDAASLWAFVAAFGHLMSPIYLFVAYGVANVLAALPLTPGGLGIVEAALIPLLVGFGVSPSIATLSVLCWRLVNFWLPIPIGAGTYLSLRLDWRRRLVAREALREIREMPAHAEPVEAGEQAPRPEELGRP
jgi:uncharacterized protein (TIRG00374 family)